MKIVDYSGSNLYQDHHCPCPSHHYHYGPLRLEATTSISITTSIITTIVMYVSITIACVTMIITSSECLLLLCMYLSLFLLTAAEAAARGEKPSWKPLQPGVCVLLCVVYVILMLVVINYSMIQFCYVRKSCYYLIVCSLGKMLVFR